METTEVYLKGFNNDVLDAANEKVSRTDNP